MEYRNVNKKQKYQKGFTIIELLVVVSIIAVLAAIVLVNVTSYIGKGKNASIKGNLATALTNAAVYYDGPIGNGSYTGFCTTTGFTNPSAAISSATGGTAPTCSTTATAFCACSVQVGTPNVYCVDSTGNKKEYAGGSCGGATPACPAASATCI